MREHLITPQSLPRSICPAAGRICSASPAPTQGRGSKPGTTLPFIEVEALCEEQKLLLSLKEKVSGPGDARLLGVLADVREVQFLLLEVISETHKVKVGGDIDERVRHDCVTILRQNLVHEEVKPDWKGKGQSQRSGAHRVTTHRGTPASRRLPPPPRRGQCGSPHCREVT